MTATGSLKAGIDDAREAGDEALRSPEPKSSALAGPVDREILVDEAIADIESGSAPAARSGVIDVLSGWLLSAALVSDLDAVEAAHAQLTRLAAAVERRYRGAANEGGTEALAELRGATSALVWVGRLAAEALVGPALIEADTYAGRMLALIESTPGVTNNAMVARLGTDKTQVSRAGRKLLDGGLAVVTRTGATNYWRLTAKGSATLRGI